MPGGIRTCAICGQDFYRKHSRWKNAVCSEECRRKRISESKLKGRYMTCKQCGKEYWAKPYTIKRGTSYCSTECFYADKAKAHKEITCQWCGKKQTVKTYAHHNRKYCSVECHDKGQTKRIIVDCTICGVDVERKLSQVKKTNATLCSPECYKKYFTENMVFFQSHTNTKPERMFNEQTPDYINQTSDGKYYVNFKNGKIKNPDFIVRPVNKTKKVIEIFGRYWHKPEEEAELVDKYKEAGYNCLVLWEEEVYEETYRDKLDTFLSNQSAVLVGNG